MPPLPVWRADALLLWVPPSGARSASAEPSQYAVAAGYHIHTAARTEFTFPAPCPPPGQGWADLQQLPEGSN